MVPLRNFLKIRAIALLVPISFAIKAPIAPRGDAHMVPSQPPTVPAEPHKYHNECCINVAKICCATLRKSAAPDFTKNCCIKVTDYKIVL
jgi:hypothetical protein